MLQPSLFWVVVDSDEDVAGRTIKTLVLPHPGDRINLDDGTPCVVERVEPPPPGSNVIKGTVYAIRA